MLTSPGIQVNVKLWKLTKMWKKKRLWKNMTEPQLFGKSQPILLQHPMMFILRSSEGQQHHDPPTLPPSSTWPQVSDQISLPQPRCIQGAKDTNIVSKNGSMIKHASHWRGTWILAPVLYDLMKTFRIMGKNYQDHIYME